MGVPLDKVWVRFLGIPESLIGDFLIIWSIGSLLGKTEKVDMPFTRLHGVVRLLVSVLQPEFIPDFVPWTYDGMTYELDVKVEETQLAENNSVINDVDMTDGGSVNGNNTIAKQVI